MLKNMVNGVEQIMSAEDEAAIRAEWAANDAAAKLKAPDPTPAEKIKAFLGNNPDVLAAVTKTK